jgi:predicted RNA-binding Zn ribbon-like protein
MTFAHDTEEALRSAAALVNTADDPDTLSTVQDLETFYLEQGWKGLRSGTAQELAEVRALRPRLRRMWTSEVEELVEEVNAMMREGAALPQIVRHDGLDWHLHVTTHDQPLATRMAVEAAMGLADAIRMGETDRLRLCEADDCDRVFVDLSRNRSRRYCDVTCSNRMAAAAYRARQSEEP